MVFCTETSVKLCYDNCGAFDHVLEQECMMMRNENEVYACLVPPGFLNLET